MSQQEKKHLIKLSYAFMGLISGSLISFTIIGYFLGHHFFDDKGPTIFFFSPLVIGLFFAAWGYLSEHKMTNFLQRLWELTANDHRRY